MFGGCVLVVVSSQFRCEGQGSSWLLLVLEAVVLVLLLVGYGSTCLHLFESKVKSSQFSLGQNLVVSERCTNESSTACQPAPDLHRTFSDPPAGDLQRHGTTSLVWAVGLNLVLEDLDVPTRDNAGPTSDLILELQWPIKGSG